MAWLNTGTPKQTNKEIYEGTHTTFLDGPFLTCS